MRLLVNNFPTMPPELPIPTMIRSNSHAFADMFSLRIPIVCDEYNVHSMWKVHILYFVDLDGITYLPPAVYVPKIK